MDTTIEARVARLEGRHEDFAAVQRDDQRDQWTHIGNLREGISALQRDVALSNERGNQIIAILETMREESARRSDTLCAREDANSNAFALFKTEVETRLATLSRSVGDAAALAAEKRRWQGIIIPVLGSALTGLVVLFLTRYLNGH